MPRGTFRPSPPDARDLPHHLPLGPAPRHAGLPGRPRARLYPPQRRSAVGARWRHRRRVGLDPDVALAAVAQRRGPEAAARGAQGRRDGLRARQPRRRRAAVRRHHVRRHPRPARVGPRDRRRPPPAGAPRRRVRRRRAAGALAEQGWRPGLRGVAAHEHRRRRRARADGQAVLVAGGGAEGPDQEGAAVRGPVRGGRRGLGRPEGRGRRGVRAHPPPRAPDDLGRQRDGALRQLRRLGRELHGPRRALGRPPGDRAVDRRAAGARRRRPGDGRRASAGRRVGTGRRAGAPGRCGGQAASVGLPPQPVLDR